MARLALPGLVGSALVVFVACAAFACGPSFQAVYEGELHFEHCYALDEKAVSDDAKKECWRDWLRGYTYGQSNDRVEYAATRFSQLSLDPTLPSVDVRDAGGGAPRRSPRLLAAPMPTNAFAPPPNMSAAELREAAEADPDAGRMAHAVLAANVPGAECVAACEERWSGCEASCKDRACDACDRAYRRCAASCFRDDAGAPKGR